MVVFILLNMYNNNIDTLNLCHQIGLHSSMNICYVGNNTVVIHTTLGHNIIQFDQNVVLQAMFMITQRIKFSILENIISALHTMLHKHRTHIM